jgi:hypothetical protein
MRVSKMAGQLNRSNSRSFVILGESEKGSPRLIKSDSLPYKSRQLAPKPTQSSYLTGQDKRIAYLGSVAERDSRASSGGESSVTHLFVVIVRIRNVSQPAAALQTILWG